MAADLGVVRPPAAPAPHRRRGWVAALVATVLVLGYLAAISSTHVALSSDPVFWSTGVTGPGGRSAPASAWSSLPFDMRNTVAPAGGFSDIAWVTEPGERFQFGFEVHNGGPVPVTLLGLGPRHLDQVVQVLAPVSAQLGVSGRTTAFHPVSVSPGATVAVALTERVVCDRTIRQDALIEARDGSSSSVQAQSTSPVVVHYRVLGATMTQTLHVGHPLLVIEPYRVCR